MLIPLFDALHLGFSPLQLINTKNFLGPIFQLIPFLLKLDFLH